VGSSRRPSLMLLLLEFSCTAAGEITTALPLAESTVAADRQAGGCATFGAWSMKDRA